MTQYENIIGIIAIVFALVSVGYLLYDAGVSSVEDRLFAEELRKQDEYIAKRKQERLEKTNEIETPVNLTTSEWITDRVPTKEDADYQGMVWLGDENGKIYRDHFENFDVGDAWQRIVVPNPYAVPNNNIEIKEKVIVFAEDVAELEQSYEELLNALEEISNVYNEAIKPRTESMGMYYAAHIMVAIADKAIAKSKEKYNEL